MTEEYVYGWKLLGPYGATEYDGEETIYPLPGPGEKWGPELSHPDPVTDGNDCGPGRYHIMCRLDARYAPAGWWPWFARGKDIAGRSSEKVGIHHISLRRVPKRVFWRIVRRGWCSGADLCRVDLHRADLCGANLREANHNEYTIWPEAIEPP